MDSMEIVDQLKRFGVLKSEHLEGAFRKIRREDFLPEDVKPSAPVDSALPIGFGQTNSQPYTVCLMLEWLELEPGLKVLDERLRLDDSANCRSCWVKGIGDRC